MARASWIYIVIDEEKPIPEAIMNTFTVKWEALAWMQRTGNENKLLMQWRDNSFTPNTGKITERE